ncbi:TolC family protein [Chryseobacterium gleum]|uniref:TolC family protein n=1 Tax=Chryseobacterium gleum TaxID=250 RepID=UPI0028A9E5A8|nr:efflux transporter outer membrane subunit [Chryseobacterium gleum]
MSKDNFKIQKMTSIKHTIKSTLVLVSAGIIISCTAEKYRKPELSLPQKFRNDERGEIKTSLGETHYKEFFKDPVLISLLDKAMKKNYDVQVALKQIEFASLAYNQSKWGNVPKINATIAGATITRPSDNSMNGMMAGQFMGKRYMGDYMTSASFSWEADIWGKIKGAKDQSLAEYLQTQEASKAVKIRLVSDIADGYYNLLMLDKQLEITKSNLSVADSTLVILKKQYELGLTTSLAIEQQEINRNQILKSISPLESSINIQENALSILSGEMPSKIDRSQSIDQILYPDVLPDVGVPSELLSYRPDVKNSELELRKSFTAIHLAKVNMYPALNITGQGGLNSFKISDWFNIPGSLFGIIGGSIAAPVLNGKELKTKYEQSKIKMDQSELNFKQTVLKAVGEVSDALAELNKLEEQQKISEQLVLQAKSNVNNSLMLYKYNEATYLDVLLSQTNKLQIELDLVFIRNQRLHAITSLYRSLGGGWQ